ncbi:hypothetical protein ACJRO7_008666 [Eucalyptus globulus]|uniref:CCHC-type domain-containing protein n=1 Tax=Eucalyptus globulus TaxID=34317 RepID=A0ABD3IRR1_EUCGL
MAGENDEERRVAALCKSLGTLWSEDDVVEIKGGISAEKLAECRKTLFGKLHSKPHVNFTAFFTTIKKVWKVDNVTCTVIAPGYFSFTFQSEADKKRVVDSGPWSFSGSLLVLQQCEPDIPDLCYEFTHCDFWVHFYGLPLGRATYESIRDIAAKLGEVVEVKLDTKGNSNSKFGKAKVKINLEMPLKTGVLLNLENKRLWVEFKYERLPNYCYSCGKIGHYASDCKDIPYENSGLAGNLPGRFGHWLRAEARELSPYGKIFYGKQDILPNEDEIVPETPTNSAPETAIYQQHRNTNQILAICEPGHVEQQTTQEISQPNQQFPLVIMKEKGPQKRGNSCIDKESAMVLYEEQHKEAEMEMEQNITGEKGLIRHKSRCTKGANTKKGKRFCPYGAQSSKTPEFDNTQLVETPIEVAEKSSQWALVASPNKPPVHP